MEKISVSVIVTVYNGAQHIKKCIESLIKQSLNNLEIVLVDHGSVDETWSIITEYSNKYKKISAYKIAHEGTQGKGRNFGIAHAKGEYIGACDADDYMDTCALELMYKKAKEGEYDIVCAPMYEVSNGNLKLTRVTPNPTVKSMITGSSMSLCNKIIKKSLFEKCVKMREDIYYEDVSICPILISYANKIGYIDLPVYYYVIREKSTTHSDKFVKCLDYIEASKYAIGNCNPQYVDRLVSLFMRGSMGYIKRHRHLSQAFIQYIHDLYCNYPRAIEYVLNEEWKKQFIEWGKACTFIPRIMYLNGFINNIDTEYVKYLEKNAFYEKCKIIILNEQNFNLDSDLLANSLYQQNDFEGLGFYLGSKLIYETGGFYLQDKISIETFFEAVTQYDLVLECTVKNNITSRILGGKSGAVILREIIDVFENLKTNVDMRTNETLSDFIFNKFGSKNIDNEILICNNEKTFILNTENEKEIDKIFQWI